MRARRAPNHTPDGAAGWAYWLPGGSGRCADLALPDGIGIRDRRLTERRPHRLRCRGGPVLLRGLLLGNISEKKKDPALMAGLARGLGVMARLADQPRCERGTGEKEMAFHITGTRPDQAFGRAEARHRIGQGGKGERCEIGMRVRRPRRA